MEMTEVVIQLANQLGIASTELVKIYAEPRALIGILNVTSLLIVIGFSLLIGSLTFQKIKDTDIDSEGCVILSAIITIISAGILAGITSVFAGAILNIHYSEYMAIDTLLNKFMSIN